MNLEKLGETVSNGRWKFIKVIFARKVGRRSSVETGLSVCKTVDPARFFFSGTSIHPRSKVSGHFKIQQRLCGELTFAFFFFFKTWTSRHLNIICKNIGN